MTGEGEISNLARKAVKEILLSKKGKKRVARAKAPKPETQDNVIDIMAALKKSIQAEGSRRSR